MLERDQSYRVSLVKVSQMLSLSHSLNLTELHCLLLTIELSRCAVVVCTGGDRGRHGGHLQNESELTPHTSPGEGADITYAGQTELTLAVCHGHPGDEKSGQPWV